MLFSTGDMPYAYNSYGYIDELDKIEVDDIKKYYDSMLKDDLVDVYVVGNVNCEEIKNILSGYNADFQQVNFSGR